MMAVAGVPAALYQGGTQVLVKGLGHGGMLDILRLKLLKKGKRTKPGEIDELIENHQVSPADFLSQGSDGCGGQNGFASQIGQSPDMSPVVHMSGGNRMLPSMPCHQGHFNTADKSDADGRMRFSPLRFHLLIPRTAEYGRVIQPAASDDSNHICPPVGNYTLRIKHEQSLSGKISLKGNAAGFAGNGDTSTAQGPALPESGPAAAESGWKFPDGGRDRHLEKRRGLEHC
jgi:hypothetical protein